MDVGGLCFTGAGHVLQYALVHLVALLWILEAQQKCGLFWLARHSIHLYQLELQTYFEQLEATLEKFCEICNLVVDHLLVIDVVVRLKVNSGVCDEKNALNLHQWKNLLHMELVLKLRQFTDVLETTFVEFDLLVAHDAT